METLVFKRKKYIVEETLLDSECKKSYLVSFKNKKYVYSLFSDVINYKKEIERYKRITDYGISVPPIVKKSKKQCAFLNKYVGDLTADKILAKEDISDKIFEQLFIIYRFARFSHVELDYMPEKYAFYKDKLYYLSYEFYPQNNDKNLENYGIRYWFSGKEGLSHLKELGYDVDNSRLIDNASLNKKIVLLSIMKW